VSTSGTTPPAGDPLEGASREIKALQKDSCPACGAQATWNPAKQALLCSYCGTEAPGELDTDSGKIREIDLVTALRELPERLRGWKAPKRSVRCRHCHAISVFDPERVGQNCDFCGSPEVLDYDEIKSPIRPQSLLPFKVDETRMREAVRKWYGSKWLAPGKFKSRAMLDTARGMYVPYWTFDAQTHSKWRADSGTYYYTSERVRGPDGKMVTRQVQRVRWQPASGELDHFFDDEPVPGTQGLHPQLLRQIEPFPTTSDLVPYDTAYLSGFVVEHYQVVLIDAAQAARDSMTRQLQELCGRQVPGDTYRGLRAQSDYGGETFKHILVPVWILAYQYGPKTYQLLMNGYTGRLAGEYPKSPWKIAFLVMMAILLILLIGAFAS
jgi:hypothetical protein